MQEVRFIALGECCPIQLLLRNNNKYSQQQFIHQVFALLTTSPSDRSMSWAMKAMKFIDESWAFLQDEEQKRKRLVQTSRFQVKFTVYLWPMALPVAKTLWSSYQGHRIGCSIIFFLPHANHIDLQTLSICAV